MPVVKSCGNKRILIGETLKRLRAGIITRFLKGQVQLMGDKEIWKGAFLV